MKSRHEELAHLLPDYLRGDLAPAQAGEVENHLGDCAECREECMFLSSLVRDDAPDPGDLFWKTLPQKVKAEAAAGRRKASPWRRLLFRPIPALAVSIVLLVAVYFVLAPREEYVAEIDPHFRPPLAAEVTIDEQLTDRDAVLIASSIAGEELALVQELRVDPSYQEDLATLGPEELAALQIILAQRITTGG